MPALPTVTRRDVVRLGLASAVTVGLVACTRASSDDTSPTAPGGPEDPDRALRAEVGRAEASLSALYAQVTSGLGTAAAAPLTALGARHEAYRQAIDPDRLAESPTATSSASSPAGAATPSASAPPPKGATPTAQLKAAETQAAKDRVAQAGRAADPELARLIVLAGAGAAGAAAVLTAGVS